MMKIALAGVSHWHTPLFLTPLLEEKGVEFVGVSDPDAQVVGRYAEKLGCRGFLSYKD